MHLFYTPDICGKNYTLNSEESNHCARVLRLTQGDIIHLIDGKGGLYTAKIVDPGSHACQVEIIDTQHEFGKHNYSLHIGIAPTKNIDRYEWFLEKTTEIGIDCITPLLCEHSERKAVKYDRSVKIITAAVKQSLTAYHPQLQPLTPFAEFVQQPFEGIKCIAHCQPSPKILLQQAIKKGTPILILIGAEGDFSPAEIAMAKEHNFIEVSLGNSRLRTETAGIIACHTVALLGTKRAADEKCC